VSEWEICFIKTQQDYYASFVAILTILICYKRFCFSLFSLLWKYEIRLKRTPYFLYVSMCILPTTFENQYRSSQNLLCILCHLKPSQRRISSVRPVNNRKNAAEIDDHETWYVQGDSNMTGTDLCVNKPHMSRSYLNHLVYRAIWYNLNGALHKSLQWVIPTLHCSVSYLVVDFITHSNCFLFVVSDTQIVVKGK
jgi:hypothetical protein